MQLTFTFNILICMFQICIIIYNLISNNLCYLKILMINKIKRPTHADVRARETGAVFRSRHGSGEQFHIATSTTLIAHTA